MSLPHKVLPDTRQEVRRNFESVDERLNVVLNAANVTGARDDGTALANLITALEAKGIITDSTTAT